MLRRDLDALAHRALGEVLTKIETLTEAVRATAASEDARVRLVIVLEPLDAEPAQASELREIHDDILSAAPCPGARPASFKRLAALAGYGNNQNFRDAANLLVDLGLLVRVKGGVRRPG